MNHKGVTVIELLIYIGLFIIISLIVGRQFKALTTNYSAGKRIARQQTDTRDVLGLMVREIRNTGLKAYFTGDNLSRSKNLSKAAEVIVSSGTDSSSFIHKEQASGAFNDNFTILKLRLSSSGDYKYTDTIEYNVECTTLTQMIKTTDRPTNIKSVIAHNVYGLQFHYGVTGKDTLIYDDDPINPSSWAVTSGTAIKTNGTNQFTLTFSGAGTGAIKCSQRKPVVGNCTYTVQLQSIVSPVTLVQIDSLRFAFKNSGEYYAAEAFRPYQTAMSIPVQTFGSGSADMLLEYDMKGAGSLTITGIKVYRTEDSLYTWKTNPTSVADKRNVKAIRMYVLIRSAGTTGSAAPHSINVGSLVFTPPAGNYAWRVHETTIEVPNNGMF